MRWAIGLMALVALLVTATAHAEPSIVVVNGSAGAHDKSIAMDAVTKVVRDAGWPLVEQSLAPKELKAVLECIRQPEAAACVARAVRNRGIVRLAIVSVDPQPTNQGGTQLVITERLILASADSVVNAQRFCDHCTDDTLAKLAIDLTRELLDRVAVGSGRTVLSIKSTPRGARFSIETGVSGATDAVIDVVPGTHIVTIEREGYDSVSRTVECAEGKTAEVSVTLKPKSSTSTGPNNHVVTPPQVIVPPRPSRALPVSLLAVGGAAIVTGVVLFAIDEDQVSDPDVDQPRTFRDSAKPGLGIAITGAVVAGIGGYLFLKYSSTAAPTVAPVTGGAVLGVTKAF